MAVFTTERTARKEHKCDRCGGQIEPGERYETYAITPNSDLGNRTRCGSRSRTSTRAPARSATRPTAMPEPEPYRQTQERCPLCPVVVQRTPQGTLADGMAAHRLAVHKGEEAARG